MAAEYRIVRDAFQGFEVQYRHRLVFGLKTPWHMPVCNTYSTVEQAEAWAKNYAMNGEAVKSLGSLPGRR